ncbi:DUF5949 family protein [Streptomyces jumonjinensis]|uniref:DUF5949 family protein n=1 Tax=Streptomyces jumonjinensis TaxID=1945 RepID=UPI0037BD44CA
MNTAQANPAKNSVQRSHLGTLSMLAWTGDPGAGHDMPYLLLYSLGDGDGGPEAGVAAMAALVGTAGMKIGSEMTDATAASYNFPVRLLVEGGHAVLNMPSLSAQCAAPPEWLTAVDARGHAHLMIATRPWPVAAPGEPVAEETLKGYLGADETLMTCGHALLPVSRLRR